MSDQNVILQASNLFDIIKNHKVSVEEVDPNRAQVGPSVIRYRVKLAPGAKVSKLRRSAEDIGREMAAEATPIIDNIPGEIYVSVDIARPDRRVEYLSPKILENLPSDPHKVLDLNIAAGVTPGGEHVVVNLASMPHMLVAGSTSSGKTVFLHSILMSLLSKLSEDELEILLIDPKATDFPLYKDVPHLRGGKVYTESKEALVQLRKLTSTELPRRTEILQEAGFPNIREYNAKEFNLMKPIVVIVDEYADLVTMLSKKERDSFEKAMTRLAQRARSVGIHLVLATQRPGVSTLSGLLKANIPCRVAFRLPQQVDSRVTLDQQGAENLLGKGDMLLKQDKAIRLQGYFISTEEIRGKLETMFPPKKKEKTIVSMENTKEESPVVEKQSKLMTAWNIFIALTLLHLFATFVFKGH